jgi:hypothetical protein
MLDPAAIARMLAALGPNDRSALAAVQAYGGEIPMLIMEREYGRLRVPESYPNPYSYLLALEEPASATERLYTCGLLQRIVSGRDRYYGIAPDLLALLPPVARRSVTLQFTAIDSPSEVLVGDTGILERYLLELFTLAYEGQLAVIGQGSLNKASLVHLARRFDPQAKLNGVTREEQWPFVRFLRCIALGAHLLRTDADGLLRPTREALAWMQLAAGERLRQLMEGWIASDWDELTIFCGLRIPNSFRRDIHHGKRWLQQIVGQIPAETWCSFAELIAAVRQAEPDFLRPNGDFDSWRITDRAGRPLDGFEHWPDVEGRLISAVVGESLRWLGLADLGMEEKHPISFRLTALGSAVLRGSTLPLDPPIARLVLQPNFEVVVPPGCSLYGRFQIGRIAEQVSTRTNQSTDEAALFRLTRRSIHTAFGRGIGIAEMLAFLEEQTGREIPQNVAATVREWSGEYGRVGLRRAVLLEADDRSTLERIRHDKRLRLPEVEQIGEQAWAVPDGEAAALAERLRQAGYGLAGDIEEPNAPFAERDLVIILTALTFYAEASGLLGLDADASTLVRRRVMRLLPERVLNRAYQSNREVIERLRKQLDQHHTE